MSRKYKGLVEIWREIASARLAKYPEDGAALGLQKCAADLEAALKSNACERTLAAILLAAGFLIFEVTPDYVQEQGSVSYTLAEPRQFPPGVPPAVPASEHTHKEQDEPRTFSVRGWSASGSNVTAQLISGSTVLPPGIKNHKDKP
jgi:hypothetical protein